MEADITPAVATRAQASWVKKIKQKWRGVVEDILEVGAMLNQAKEELPHGAFGLMIATELPFGRGTAERLMSISSDERFQDAAHVPHLPPSWGTLYELTKLPKETFEAGIAGGTIFPGMTRADATKLRTGSATDGTTDEWGTPPSLARLVRTVLGGIGDVLSHAPHRLRPAWRRQADVVAATVSDGFLPRAAPRSIPRNLCRRRADLRVDSPGHPPD